MTGRVTPDEAKIINAYFKAVKTVRNLSDLAETRYLTSREGATLREGMEAVENLRGQVRTINLRSFSSNQNGDKAAA